MGLQLDQITIFPDLYSDGVDIVENVARYVCTLDSECEKIDGYTLDPNKTSLRDAVISLLNAKTDGQTFIGNEISISIRLPLCKRVVVGVHPKEMSLNESEKIKDKVTAIVENDGCLFYLGENGWLGQKAVMFFWSLIELTHGGKAAQLYKDKPFPKPIAIAGLYEKLETILSDPYVSISLENKKQQKDFVESVKNEARQQHRYDELIKLCEKYDLEVEESCKSFSFKQWF